MRALPATIQIGFAGHRQPLARCVKLQLRDGTILAFTEHDEDLQVDIGDGGGTVTYRADLGILSGDIELVVGLESSNTEIIAPLRDTVTRRAALGRRFNQAWVWIFDVDWNSSEYLEPLELMKGWVAQSWVKGNSAVFEVRSLADFFNMVQGRILSPRCSADFGDALCGKAKVDTPATVTSRISNMEFTVNLALADGYFRFGEGEFQTGDLADAGTFEVFDYVGSTGLVVALAPLPDIPQVGDTLDLRQGCSKVKLLADPAIPTCVFHNNARRFRGFDRVPGSDVFLRPPIPGEGG